MEALYGEILGNGALVGEWEIERFVSRGGFAAVYRATDARGAHVAIKVLETSLSRSPSMLRRFEQEVVAISALDHPNIVRTLGSGATYDGRPYLVLEWVEGETLADHLRTRGVFAVAEAIAIVGQIAEALCAAHSRDVIHRDVKPENVIAIAKGEAWHVKLVDFGIAKLLSPLDGHNPVTTTTIYGTPSAMAPEQILGHPLDGRADVYGLGVLLFQLVCGAPPFAIESVAALERLHLESVAPKVSARMPAAAVLDVIVARCLAKEPADRFGDMASLAAALLAAESSGPSQRILLRATVRGDNAAAVDAACEAAIEALKASGASIVFEAATSFAAAFEAEPAAALECALAVSSAELAVSLSIALGGAIDTLSSEHWPDRFGVVSLDDEIADRIERTRLDDQRVTRCQGDDVA